MKRSRTTAGEAHSSPPAELEVRPLANRSGLSAAGEVSLTTHQTWASALDVLADRQEDVYLDLAGLTFVDVAGASTLAATALSRGVGRRMVIERPPPSLRRTLDMFWPDLATIEVTG
ncbi:STAS domain-containing protein [Streptomyces sp. H27-C3]|uniref:STAS domain-containing protein n=1 Tax=Streptomyces sp. H27-C3 TaxID=3046305 RepID=UPI0024BB99F5|nr:STAS domain-containing protein [Streptomyces sp. H27-C3]MDJ0462066.1 STAS domain-containing protein [Streptomyces sp. H27-C3]